MRVTQYVDGQAIDVYNDEKRTLPTPLLCTQCTAPLKGNVCEYCGTRYANAVPRVVMEHPTHHIVETGCTTRELARTLSEVLRATGVSLGK